MSERTGKFQLFYRIFTTSYFVCEPRTIKKMVKNTIFKFEIVLDMSVKNHKKIGHRMERFLRKYQFAFSIMSQIICKEIFVKSKNFYLKGQNTN